MWPPAGFLLTALLGVLSFPPVGLWPLSYVAWLPFLSAVTRPIARPFLRGYLAGLLFYAGLLYWIGLNSGAPPYLTWPSVLAVVAILATVWGIIAWAVARTARRFGLPTAILLFVILYTFLEVFWGTGELGFPWAVWGLTQVGFLPALQIADCVDVYGLSAWVLALNALVFLWWKERSRRRALVMVLLPLALVPPTYGVLRLATLAQKETVSVAAVQANVPAETKWNLAVEDITARHLRESWPLANSDIRLLVWPETATPAPLRYRPWIRDTLQAFVNATEMSLLTGASDYEGDGRGGMRAYNAAFLLRPHEREPLRYAKIHLVPFGERIPGQKLFPFLRNLHLGQAEWAPGPEVVVFPPHNGIPAFGCLICFEVVFPEIAADMVRRGARLLTTITNDGWYGNSSGPYQHLALARVRAVATRRAIVRSANTGISALILPTGALAARLGYNRSGAVTGRVPLCDEITLAVRLARAWPGIYTGLLVLLLAWLGYRSRFRAQGM